MLPNSDDSFASINTPVNTPVDAKQVNTPVELCHNCGRWHTLKDCVFPKFFYPCNRCLVTSFDGHSHSSPCMAMNTVSLVRPIILSRETASLFGMRLVDVECDVSFLSPNGAFEKISNTLTSPVANCIITTHGRKFKFIDFGSAYFSRFSIAIAIFQNGLWRKRFSAVLTNKHGLLLFKARSTLTLANGRYVNPDPSKNTVIVIGLKPKRNALTVGFDVYANEAGDPTDDKIGFNGYSGEVSWCMVPNEDGQTE